MNKEQASQIIEELNNDKIFQLRNQLNIEFPTREEFHSMYNKVKNLPEFFQLAKNRVQE